MASSRKMEDNLRQTNSCSALVKRLAKITIKYVQGEEDLEEKGWVKTVMIVRIEYMLQIGQEMGGK